MKIGVSKVEIPARIPGIGMFGWGVPSNFVEESATPIHARAFLLQGESETLAIVCCELLCVSQAIKESVVRALEELPAETGLRRPNLMLLATHTHSAPGGYSTYPFYGMEAPGFSPQMLDDVTHAIVQSLLRAWETRVDGQVRFAEDSFDPDAKVAFNRSPKSWNRNPETPEITWENRHLGIDPRMRMLRFDDAAGKCLGESNFFGVHGTSVHSDNRKVHVDNKGYAASLLEKERAPEFVAAFAQATTGDITPNFQTHEGKPWVRGMYADDDASARFNGELQAEKAAEILEKAATSPALGETLVARHAHRDLAAVAVDPVMVGGREGLRTGPAKLGLAMFFGTDEGPGLPRKLLWIQTLVSRIRPLWRLVPRTSAARAAQREHDETHAEKVTAMEMSRHRFLGIRHLRNLPIGRNASPTVKMVRAFDPHGLSDPKPWTPNILPAQLFRIGSVVIAALPHELTTISGRRIEDLLAKRLKGSGVEHVVVAGYANAYAGYVTTPEEYELQDYEGASTHFGKWTLPAWMTIFADLADQLLALEPTDEQISPPLFTEEDLRDRLYASHVESSGEMQPG